MSTLNCLYSGLPYKVEHFSLSLVSAHPIYEIPLARLLDNYYKQWQSRQLTSKEAWMLATAILKQASLCHWHEAPKYNAVNFLIAEQYLPQIAEAAAKYCIYKGNVLPKVAIERTTSWAAIKTWLENWDTAHKDYLEGLAADRKRKELERLETILNTKIGVSAPNDPSKYAANLADWAAKAGDFSHSSCIVQGKTTTLANYWKSIITASYNNIDILSIPKEDILILQEHCLLTIDTGSTYSFHLFTTLNRAIATHKDFSSPTWKMLPRLPKEVPAIPEPARNAYNKLSDYLIAKAAWRKECKRLALEKEEEDIADTVAEDMQEVGGK